MISWFFQSPMSQALLSLIFCLSPLKTYPFTSDELNGRACGELKAEFALTSLPVPGSILLSAVGYNERHKKLATPKTQPHSSGPHKGWVCESGGMPTPIQAAISRKPLASKQWVHVLLLLSKGHLSASPDWQHPWSKKCSRHPLCFPLLH